MDQSSQNPSLRRGKGSSVVGIHFTDEGFLVDGLSYAGIPMLVERRTMRHLFLPCEWMIDLAIVDARCNSSLTWKAYAYDLRGFIEFSMENGFDWLHPTDEMKIGHYGAALAGRGVSRNSINRIMSTICRFYEWAAERGSITSLHLRYEAVKMNRRGFLAHIEEKNRLSARAIVIPKKTRRERLPRFFTIEERRQIIALLSERDQLIVLWALFTGAREHEICALTLDQIPEQQAYRGRTFCRVRLTETKGSVPGELFVPTWLIDRTFQHIALYGRKAVQRAALARGRIVDDHIFLSLVGNPLKADSVYNIFKDNAITVLGIQGTFHDLRHTYAITMLDRLMKAAEANPSRDGRNPLLILKHLLRHSSITSTERYLVAREFYLTDIFSDTWELPELRDDEAA